MNIAYLDGEVFIIEKIVFEGNKPYAVGYYATDKIYDEAYLENIEYREL